MDESKLRIIKVKESILEDNDADADKLREELKSRVKYDKPVRLFDDYADAATYERVLEILEDLHRSVGLIYET